MSTVADLAFNDIPLENETVEASEKGFPSNPEPKHRKKRNPRRDEIKIFTDALKRLIADYPPPRSTSRPDSTIVSSTAHTHQSNGDKNKRAIPLDSHTPRSDIPRSLSVRSHPMAVNSNRNSTTNVQERATTEQDVDTIRSRKDHTPSGQDTTNFPKYQDKGVMVSPWMHQRACKSLSYNTTSADYQLRRREAESSISRMKALMPNPNYKIPVSEVRGEATEELDFKAKRIEDMAHVPDGIPPISYCDSTSDRDPLHTFFPRRCSGLLSFDRIGASQVIDAQGRDAYSIGWPVEPITIPPHREAFQGANTHSQRTSQIVDDIPGKTLKEYIDRMEREILGAEPSARFINKSSIPAEANMLDSRRQPSKPPREIGYRDRFLQRDQPHESVDAYPKRYPRLSYPEESLDESEPAFVWQPNHMMWR
jgi:hypothetical protein